MRTPSLRFLAALTLAFVAAGCGGGASPRPSPVVESASASPSGAPTLPAEAKGTTAESAEAFVRYYFDVLAYASNTGDTSTLEKLGSPDCDSCGNVLREIKRIYSANGSVQGEQYDPQHLTVREADGGWTVSLTINASGETVIERAGASPSTSAASVVDAEFTIAPDSNGLIVRDWTRT